MHNFPKKLVSYSEKTLSCMLLSNLIHFIQVAIWINLFITESKPWDSYLDGRCVDVKFPKDGECLLEEFAIDSNVCDVWGVVVVETGDVLHDAGTVSLDGSQDQQILQVPVGSAKWNKFNSLIAKKSQSYLCLQCIWLTIGMEGPFCLSLFCNILISQFRNVIKLMDVSCAKAQWSAISFTCFFSVISIVLHTLVVDRTGKLWQALRSSRPTFC